MQGQRCRFHPIWLPCRHLPADRCGSECGPRRQSFGHHNDFGDLAYNMSDHNSSRAGELKTAEALIDDLDDASSSPQGIYILPNLFALATCLVGSVPSSWP